MQWILRLLETIGIFKLFQKCCFRGDFAKWFSATHYFHRHRNSAAREVNEYGCWVNVKAWMETDVAGYQKMYDL